MQKLATLTALAAIAVPAAVATPSASALTREFEGTVVSVNRDDRTFRLRDPQRGTVRIKVVRSTRFEDIAGFSSLRRGLRRIEAIARRSNGRWVATHIERSGRDGGRSGSGDDD